MMKFRMFVSAAMLGAAMMLAPAQAPSAFAFQGAGCMGSCADCHTLEPEEARKLLKTDQFKAEVKDIRMSPVKGIWEVEITRGTDRFIAYIDFSKKFLIEGRGGIQFTPLEKIGQEPELKTIDLSSIPLDRAVVIGNPKAEKRVIVFDDPECPYCAKLHEEIKKVTKERDDISFHIKLFPLTIHPGSYAKSKAVVCSSSAKMLDDAFAGYDLPEADCETDEIDNNIKLAESLGIRGTPAIILPDGRLLPGYVPAEVLIGLIDNAAPSEGESE